MRILAFDPSKRNTGWCLLDTEGPDWETGVIKLRDTGPNAVADGGELLAAFQFGLTDVFARANWPNVRIDHVALEDYTLGNARFNPRSLAELGEIHGVLTLFLYMHNCEVPSLWSPSAWKKHLFGDGKGGAKKDEVRVRVFQQFNGLEIKNDNELEAFCIAQAEYLFRTGKPRPAASKRPTRAQRAALADGNASARLAEEREDG